MGSIKIDLNRSFLKEGALGVALVFSFRDKVVGLFKDNLFKEVLKKGCDRDVIRFRRPVL